MFDVRKPYFALNPGLVFRDLGERRNRGIEASVAGQITPQLSIVLGAIILNAKVSGDAVDLGLIGRRPVGSIARSFNGALNWDLPWVKGLSLDLGLEVTSDRTANAANSLVIPARYALALGGRYRFDLLGKPATVRVQVPSVNDAYGFNNIGEGFYYNLPRRFQMSLTVDM